MFIESKQSLLRSYRIKLDSCYKSLTLYIRIQHNIMVQISEAGEHLQPVEEVKYWMQ